MEGMNYQAFWKFIKLLHENDLLQYVEVIGSWCEYLYAQSGYLANFDTSRYWRAFVCVDLEITGTPAIAAFMNGEVISCEVYGDCEDFDGWNEDELFDFSRLPDCLNEFLSDLEWVLKCIVKYMFINSRCKGARIFKSQRIKDYGEKRIKFIGVER